MLIEFTVQNFRSFKDKTVFTMVKSQGGELQLTNTFQPDAPKAPCLLRTGIIYGSNSSGKSNLIKALGYLKSLVLNSTEFKPNQRIPTDVFIFSDDNLQAPVEINISFLAGVSSKVELSSRESHTNNLIRYDYGVVFTHEHILEEWLHAYPKGKVQEWFYRKRDEEANNSYEYSFSSLFKGNKSNWESNTRPNVLFLSNAVNLNSEQLKPIYDWFDKKLRVSVETHSHYGESYTKSVCDDQFYKQQILDFLKSADIGIDDFSVRKKEVSINDFPLPPDFPEDLKEELMESLLGEKIIDLKSVREVDGKPKFLDFEEESEGTKKLFSIAGPIIDTLHEGNVLVLDELHNHLHPKLVEFLISNFHNSEINKNNAQLIFTTHDTYLMKKNIFRRDQIWFVEKNQGFASNLYSLHDFSVRKDRGAEYEDQYLEGLFGAVPFISSYSMPVESK